jgi:hypothetical protein
MNKMKYLCSATLVALIAVSSANAAEEEKHLFILTGQSNMAGLDLNLSFIPTVAAAFGKDNVIVVKMAYGGKPIRDWYKKWKPAQGDAPEANGYLYDRFLIKKINKSVSGKKPKTVTFVWMQGEQDAKEKHGEVYAASLRGLIDQLATDLGRKDINFVIGRLSDCDMDNKKFPHWTMVRKAQVEVAEADPRGDWVDTDDLNDGKNRFGKQIKDDLHYSVEGYKSLGERFAKKAIELIRSAQDKPVLSAEEAAPPNIVFILADDLGYADLSCYDSQEISTPHLDKMAAEGMKFTDFYAAACVCTPTRAAFLTGSYPKRVGLHNAVLGHRTKSGLNPSEITLAEYDAFFYYVRDNKLSAVRQGKWKLHLRAPSERWAGKLPKEALLATKPRTAPLWLYDLNEDIGETKDVAGENPAVVASLKKLAREFDRQLGLEMRPAYGADVRKKQKNNAK